MSSNSFEKIKDENYLQYIKNNFYSILAENLDIIMARFLI